MTDFSNSDCCPSPSSPRNKRQKISMLDSEERNFKLAFKFFKSLKNLSLSSLRSLDIPVIFPREESDPDCRLRGIKTKVESFDEMEEVQKLGLRPVKEWIIKELIQSPGAIVISNLFTKEGQQRWIRQTLMDYPPVKEFVSNLDPEWKFPQSRSEIDWWSRASGSLKNSPIWKLRWITLGYHHDWDTKLYSDDKKTAFPDDLSRLCRVFARVLAFDNFSAEAAIVNYYHLNSTLSIHQDISEPYKEAPLFSISFGQPAVFLIGPNKCEWPNCLLVQSGDVIVMSGKCRLDYHAVPKVFCDPESASIPFFPLDKDSPENHELNSYLHQSRINLNVRQVLRPGEISLRYE